jgi:hypothetical protein
MRLGAEACFWGAGKDFDSARRIVHEIGSLPGEICPSALPFEFAETRRLQRVRCFAEAPGVAVPSERAGIAGRFSRDVTGL